MIEKLDEIIIYFGTNKQDDLEKTLSSLSKDESNKLLVQLLSDYFNDVNSSSLREKVSASIAGFEPITNKHGRDGKRLNPLTNKIEVCEIKPQNKRTDSLAKKKELDGSFNFGDYTWERYNKDKKENPFIIVSGFIDGKMIYVLQFEFNSPDFLAHIQKSLTKRFPNGDELGEYYSSLAVTFSKYRNLKNLKIVYMIEKSILQKLYQQKFLTRGLFNFLTNNNEYERESYI